MTPIVLSIAGSDPTGGAGLEIDLKVIERLGAWGMAVATALTVQEPDRVHDVGIIGAEIVAERLRVLLDAVRPDAVKIGMLGDEGTVKVVAEILENRARGVPIVLDPVLRSTSGRAILTDEGTATLKSELLPLTDVLTPNLAEARVLLGRPDIEGRAAAESLLSFGSRHVVVKGGDLSGDEAIDHVASQNRRETLRAPRRPGPSPHGTGCALASAIAVGLAYGNEPFAAIAAAKRFVTEAIHRSMRLPPGAAGRRNERSVLRFSEPGRGDFG